MSPTASPPGHAMANAGPEITGEPCSGRNLRLIAAAARELSHVSLEDALRILVVLAEKRHDRFE
jgi:hypothetical protein